MTTRRGAFARRAAAALLGCALLAGCSGSVVDPITMPPSLEDATLLPVAFQPQLTQVWCWSASVSMVLSYYGAPVAQCEIVSNTVLLDCCAFPQAACVTTGPVPAMLGALQYHAALFPGLAGRPLSFAEVKAQIDAGRPMIALYSGSFSGHAVVIFGYDDQGNIAIHDPNAGTLLVPHAVTFVYGGQLIWADTIVMGR